MAGLGDLYRVFINPFAEEKDEPELIGGRKMPEKSPRPKGTVLGFVLAVLLVLLWETVFRDVNRFLNIYYPQCVGGAVGSCEASAYAGTHLFLLLLTILPLTVFLGIFHYLLQTIEPRPAYGVLLRAFAMSVGWMGARFLIALLSYLLRFHRAFGIYVVIGLAVAVLVAGILRIANDHHSFQGKDSA